MRLGGWVLPLGWVWKMGLPFLIFGEHRGKDEIVNTIASRNRDICATVKIGYRKPKQRELRLVMSCD